MKPWAVPTAKRRKIPCLTALTVLTCLHLLESLEQILRKKGLQLPLAFVMCLVEFPVDLNVPASRRKNVTQLNDQKKQHFDAEWLGQELHRQSCHIFQVRLNDWPPNATKSAMPCHTAYSPHLKTKLPSPSCGDQTNDKHVSEVAGTVAPMM